jgi:hypothetical protein
MGSRLVHLEWDRTHEEFDAIVRAESDDGVIVTEIHDFVPRRGWKWIPDDEVISIDDVPASAALVRLFELRPLVPEPIDPALTSLPALLRHLADGNLLVSVFQASTGSATMLAGAIARLDNVAVVLDLVDTAGEWEDDQFEFELDDIISVEWGNDYLLALTALAGPRGLS